VGVPVTRANEVIRSARERLGLTSEQAAARAGLTVDEYGDLEHHADEVVSAVSLATARRICGLLNITLSELLIAEQLLVPGKAGGTSSGSTRPRHRVAHQMRVAKGASIGDVANAIGFEEAAVRQGESADEYLDALPIRVLFDWARYIGADPIEMLAL
jgi:transcriptional regulator with XRE-family HTH domain